MIFLYPLRICLALTSLYVSRLVYLLVRKKFNYPKNFYPKGVLITLGSGGHTGEMLCLLG